MSQQAFHLKYRPSSLDNLIGHESAVTRLKGMIKSNKIPNAIMITGPSSVGKTTLARAFAFALNGKDAMQDYTEVNAGEQRTIEDVRSWIASARYKPRTKKRIICIDEAQGLLGNGVAVDALLKPLEEPASDTIWILCSMDPTKFATGKGPAVVKRCVQFVLEPHTQSDLLKQAMRIAKGEDMKFVLDDEKKLLKAVVKQSAGEMRTIANLMQSLDQYYAGLEDKPKKLKLEDITAVLDTTVSSEEKAAVAVMEALYSGQFKAAQKEILNVGDAFGFINKLLYLNKYLLNNAVLEGQRHPKVWATKSNRELEASVKSLKLKMGTLAAVHEALVETKSMATSFAVDAGDLLTARVYRMIKIVQANQGG